MTSFRSATQQFLGRQREWERRARLARAMFTLLELGRVSSAEKKLYYSYLARLPVACGLLVFTVWPVISCSL